MLEIKANKTIESFFGPLVRTSFTGRMMEVSSSVEKACPSGICSGPGNASPQHNALMIWERVSFCCLNGRGKHSITKGNKEITKILNI